MQFSSLVAVLVVVLSICSINAQDPLIAYAGSTDGQATFYPPYGGDPCTADSTAYSFVVFNVTFPVSGVREVAVMSDDSIDVYIYANGFNPATPCVNYIDQNGGYGELGNDYGTELSTDATFYFNASTVYYVVLAGYVDSDPTTYDYFAINIFPPVYNGNTFSSNVYWPGVVDTTDGNTACAAENDEIDLPYGNYTWTQQVSGWYDISVGFFNSSDSIDYIYVALYNTTGINVTQPCQPGFIVGASSDYNGVFLYYVWLNESVIYSIITSTDYTEDTGYFSVAIRNTWVRFPHYSGWNQPERYSDEGCVADADDTDTAWDPIVFQPNGYVTLFDTEDAPNGFEVFDTESFWYSGDNHEGVLPGSSPTTCPITLSLLTFADTGSNPMSLNTAANNTYTIVVSTWDGDSLDDGEGNYAYIYYLFTGQPIGYAPSTVSSTGTATTGSNPTTGNPTTGSATSATVTTGISPTFTPTNRPTAVPTAASTTAATITPSVRPTTVPTSKPVTTTSGASSVAATLVMAAVVAAGIQLL